PGLNLSLYANVKADKLLAEARRAIDQKTRDEKTREFIDIINDEHPAAFLYAPEFIYVVPDDLTGVRIGSITTPSERFLNVYEWHRETERVWDIFIPKEQIVTIY
ncbi:hypothetical protein HY413_01130, partial [Candidatus Kaiserbacteria bacterium]|nr:hypothetical protein [Candidatus Kaiserbacteria bacterium]